MSQSVTLSRNEFTTQLKSTSMDVSTLEKDARLKGVDIASADLDGDGKISGSKEQKALFKSLDHFDTDGKSKSVRLVDVDGNLTAMGGRLDAIADASGVQALRSLALVNGPRGGNDDIMHVGMRDANHYETDALERRAKARGQAIIKVGGDTSTVTGNDGKTYDLSKTADITGFAKTLGLPADQTKKVADAIEKAPKSGRDEMAGIAKTWAKAEKGGRIPSRLIVSGHSVGGDFFGDRGSLPKDSLMDLASAMPRAAGQIEDIHLSGCYSLGRSTTEDWRAAFPNLRTAMAYNESAPKAESSAPSHQLAWEAATRGRTNKLSRSIAHGSVVWSQKSGFDDGEALPKLKDLKDDLKAKEGTFPDYFDGTKKVTDHARGPLREYYKAIQRVIEHPSLPKSERDALRAKRDQTIRLIYFDVIAQSFAKERAGTIRDGYKAAKLTAPDFAKLSRKDAVAEIDRFLAKTAGSKDPAVLELRDQLEGMKALDAKRVPPTWIP
ncbi:MAG: hypothetical protein H6729_06220 [Deltaproteobacteria bacterium]|nr:hypothetical protein [Deltaproteobacteria bacterium]